MKLLIRGGKPLVGEISLQGAKNATSKMMVASLLTDEECVFANVPEIGEVDLVAELCAGLGAKISRNGKTLRLQTKTIKNLGSPHTQSRKNRIPILTMGPLLARCGEAEVPLLGGDKIGPRPVDLHLEALSRMGAKIEIGETSYKAKAPNGLSGTKIIFPYPSVGATENVILAAVLAKGRTVIQNAATEPEIIDLIKFLQNMGAIIELGAHRTIYIDGVKKMRGAAHTILSDRNEAASFASLALATAGDIFVRGANQGHMITFLNAVRRVGGEYRVSTDGIRFSAPKGLKAIEIETDTHPGFMTDWQQPFVVALTQASGDSVLHETVYEDRFGYSEDLNAMGANIKVFNECVGELNCRFKGESYMHSARISGPTKLKGKELTVRDLRSGIAHIIAALSAEGDSVINGIEEIDRGYENIDKRLATLGADIRRV